MHYTFLFDQNPAFGTRGTRSNYSWYTYGNCATCNFINMFTDYPTRFFLTIVLVRRVIVAI